LRVNGLILFIEEVLEKNHAIQIDMVLSPFQFWGGLSVQAKANVFQLFTDAALPR